MNGKTIAFACDHGGFILKEALTAHLKEKGYEILDFGAYSADRVEYPAVGEPACRTRPVGGERSLASPVWN